MALEDIDEEVRRPGGIGKMRAKLNELWALVGALSAARGQDAKEGGMGWAVVDEDGLERIAQVRVILPVVDLGRLEFGIVRRWILITLFEISFRCLPTNRLVWPMSRKY